MDKKTEWKFFVLPEYEEEEQYLNEMAKAGWKFESVSMLGKYTFKKHTCEDMIYRLDFNPQKEEDRAAYLQMYADYGWEYVTDLNEYSYFRKINDGENEIFNDDESRMDMMKRIVQKKFLPIICIFLCIIVPQALSVTHIVKSDAAQITLYVLDALITLLYVYMIARCMAGFNRLNKKYGEKK